MYAYAYADPNIFARYISRQHFKTKMLICLSEMSLLLYNMDKIYYTIHIYNMDKSVHAQCLF